MSGADVVTEYAIRWRKRIPGVPDVSTPRESRAMVEMALEGSAFDGEIVSRTVTRTAWTAAQPGDGGDAAAGGGES